MNEKLKKHSKSDIFKLLLSFIGIIFIIVILSKYLINNEFRDAVDTRIFNKSVTENKKNIIEIDSETNPHIYAYDRYITVLNKNILSFYNQDANVVSEVDINITNPCFATNNNYLAIAENEGNKLYLITDTEMKWEKEIEGSIYRISINKNGYISVLFKNNNTHKSIIVVYDVEGKELFKIYLATNNYAICSEISNNNKYLAMGQIDYSGTVVKSIVKVISVDLIKSDPKNSTVYTYESESGKILNNIKFNDKNEAICMFNSYIQKITTLSDERIYDITDNNMFVDINLANNIIIVEKETSGLFSYNYQINIKNTIGKSDSLYILENDIPKNMKVIRNLICLNLSNEVRIINSNAWLLKRYTTNNEIQDIVIGEHILGIIYNNKIEVINI